MANETSSIDSTKMRIGTCCVGEAFLKSVISSAGEEAECSYCNAEGKPLSIVEVADHVEKAFDQHYDRTSSNPDNDWEHHGEEVVWAIANAASIDEQPATDIQSVLEDRHYDHELAQMGEESPFSSDSYYELKDLDCVEFSEKWHQFEQGLKTEARFFSRGAQSILAELFSDLPNLRTSNGHPVVVTIGPETPTLSLHRARVFAAEEDKLKHALGEPWTGLGSPPMLAAAAGRMNARGISVFYGAIEPGTALAEVRPAVGSQVAVAKFTIIRPLRLLDVEALRSVKVVGSVFDPNYLRQAQQAQFMKILSRRMTRPVMPNEETFEYLATQAVADYLATECKLDGIIFPSVQTDHKSSNVVLFHHASRVEKVQLPEGTEISVGIDCQDEDGSYPEYRVSEEVPKVTTAPAKDYKRIAFRVLAYSQASEKDHDTRPVSLKIDLENIKVHHVKAVRFETEEFPVHRHRSEKQDGDDF